MNDQRISKLANQFLAQHGPISKAMLPRLSQQLQEGTIELKGVSMEEAGKALRLAQVATMATMPEWYESASDKPSPELGKQLVESTELQSPETQRLISQNAGVEEYSAALQARGIEQAPPPDKQTPSSLELPETSEAQTVPMDQADYTVGLSPSGKAYQRVSGSGNVYRAQSQGAQGVVTGSVQMHERNQGGTYRGRATGTGDSRVENQLRQQIFSNAKGGQVDTSKSAGS